MKKIGKISAIKKQFSTTQQTMQTELSKKGFTRVPGTGVFKYPYKEIDGRYRTGLDPDAAYIKRIEDSVARDLERKRVQELFDKLTGILGIDLKPTSKFWNYAQSLGTEDFTHVQPVKLMDGDNLFDLSSPWQELTYAWLRVHPTIASSYQAWERGQYPADTQFFVADDEVENAVVFKKKQLINKAIISFNDMTPTKRKKVARLLGLPVTEETKEEVVYNLVDDLLKETEFKGGVHRGLSPVQVFTKFANMEENILHVRDLVKQAIAHSVYRVKPSGKIYEGEFEVATDEDDLVKHLADDENQSDLLVLEGKLKGKKLAAV